MDGSMSTNNTTLHNYSEMTGTTMDQTMGSNITQSANHSPSQNFTQNDDSTCDTSQNPQNSKTTPKKEIENSEFTDPERCELNEMETKVMNKYKNDLEATPNTF